MTMNKHGLFVFFFFFNKENGFGVSDFFFLSSLFLYYFVFSADERKISIAGIWFSLLFLFNYWSCVFIVVFSFTLWCTGRDYHGSGLVRFYLIPTFTFILVT